MRAPYILFLLLGILLSCKPDPKVPKWDVEALAPLIHSRVDINDIVQDSSLSVSQDGALSLIYQNKLAELKPDEIFTPLNEVYENVINLNSIDFGTRVLNRSISLGELSKGGTPQGQFIIFNHGKRAVVPPFTPVYFKRFPINVTNLFQTINLSSGKATLEISNGLPVALNTISFLLENSISQTQIIRRNIDTLKTGEVYTEEFPLSNITIEGLLNAELIRFSSPGSNGDTILIDTTDRISLKITLSDLVPTSATAIFPAQDLANDTTITNVPTGQSQLTSIKIKEGSIFLDATSTIEDEIKLDYNVPNATKNSTGLSFNESIPPAPPGGTSTKFKQVNLVDYSVDLTGLPTDIGIYNSFYTTLRGRIDSTGNLVNLSLDDSVLLKTGITNLIASEGYGYLGKDTIEGNETSKVDFFNIVQGGSVDLHDVRLGIGIENSIGAPIDVRLNSLKAQRTTGAVALNWTSLGADQTVPAATLVNNIPAPGRLDLGMNRSNSNLDKLFENQPDLLEADFTAFINGSTSTPDFQQFIFSDYGINVYLNMEVPLDFSARGILLADTNEFDYTQLDPDNQLQNGALKIIADNNFPLECRIEMILLDNTKIEIGRLTSPDIVEAATIDNNGAAIGSVKSISEYPLNSEAVKMLRKTEHLVFQVTLDTPLPPQKVKLYSNNFMDLTLSGDLTIRTK